MKFNFIINKLCFRGYLDIWMQSHAFSSVQFSHSVVSDSLRSQGLQHARPPCPSPIPGVYSNSCPLSRCCHPTTSSSVVPFSSCPQSFPASGSFPMSQLFASGAQSIGASASASVLPMYQVLFYSKYLHCRNCSWKQFYAGFIIWAIFLLLLARLSTI